MLQVAATTASKSYHKLGRSHLYADMYNFQLAFPLLKCAWLLEQLSMGKNKKRKMKMKKRASETPMPSLVMSAAARDGKFQWPTGSMRRGRPVSLRHSDNDNKDTNNMGLT